jgi:hypothetical protein
LGDHRARFLRLLANFGMVRKRTALLPRWPFSVRAAAQCLEMDGAQVAGSGLINPHPRIMARGSGSGIKGLQLSVSPFTLQPRRSLPQLLLLLMPPRRLTLKLLMMMLPLPLSLQEPASPLSASPPLSSPALYPLSLPSTTHLIDTIFRQTALSCLLLPTQALALLPAPMPPSFLLPRLQLRMLPSLSCLLLPTQAQALLLAPMPPSFLLPQQSVHG